jgi:hypothetical protein
MIGASLLAISVVALVTYFATLQVGFVWDDWGFIDFLITKSFPDYLVQYFDPRVQFIWYRPMYGMLWWVGYVFSGTNPAGYHLIHLFLHLGNTLLLFALTRRVSRNVSVAVVAALVYIGLPRISEAVMWPADAQPEATFFYLLALWFWLVYLETKRARHFGVTLLFAALAILSKETAVTLPLLLFAAERLLVNKPVTWKQLMRRYAPFAILLLLYAGAMYRVLTYGLFPRQFSYKPSLQIVPNLVQ